MAPKQKYNSQLTLDQFSRNVKDYIYVTVCMPLLQVIVSMPALSLLQVHTYLPICFDPNYSGTSNLGLGFLNSLD
jgi:hypothetical protein